jgi:hypothetical protein
MSMLRRRELCYFIVIIEIFVASFLLTPAAEGVICRENGGFFTQIIVNPNRLYRSEDPRLFPLIMLGKEVKWPSRNDSSPRGLHLLES